MRCAYFVRGRRLFPACFREQVPGLELLRVELPRRKGAARRVLRRLARSGVVRALNLPGLDRYPVPCPRLVETGELYRRKAAELALWDLRRRGLDPAACVVGLQARHWSAALERTAAQLVPRVKGLALVLRQPEAQRLAAAELFRRWGVPVLQGAGDVTLCFAPEPPGPNRLLLGEERPRVEGLHWRCRGAELPREAPEDALVCVLLELGCIGWEEVFCAEGPENGGKVPGQPGLSGQ